MKKVYIVLACLFYGLLVSCELPVTNARLINETESQSTVIVAYTTNGMTRTHTLAAGESIQTTALYTDISSIRVVKDSGNVNISDNRYKATVGFGKVGIFSISDVRPTIYTITNLVPSAKYSGSGHLYLTERNNKIGIYAPSDENRIELVQGLVANVTVYADSPQFVLVDGEGNENRLNGYRVTCEVKEGNNIVIM